MTEQHTDCHLFLTVPKMFRVRSRWEKVTAKETQKREGGDSRQQVFSVSAITFILKLQPFVMFL